MMKGATMYLVCVMIMLMSIMQLVQAHSWVQCVDYTEENGRQWDATNCRGWPRNYQAAFQYQGYGFGADAGYNFQPTEGSPCKYQPSAGAYTTTYPKASYSPGQRVCLAWPPKNHVAAVCNNPNIGDAGTKIYRSGLNPTADPTLSQFEQNLVYDFGTNTGQQGIGFQNCPDFCANPDKALCTGCFNMPNLPLGSYTFLWEWAFNGPNDKYSTCFDVEIVAATGNKLADVYSKVTPDSYTGIKGTANDQSTPYEGPAGGATGGGATAAAIAAAANTASSSSSATNTGTASNTAGTAGSSGTVGGITVGSGAVSGGSSGGDAEVSGGGSGGASGGDGGLSPGGKAAIALVVIGLFAAAIITAVIYHRRNGHIFGYTIQKMSSMPPARGGGDYAAFRDQKA